MKEIDIKDYFIEIIDEGRSTIGYDCVPYKTNELVHKIYKQNTELKRLEQENEKLKEKNKNLKDHKKYLFKDNDRLMRENSLLKFELQTAKDFAQRMENQREIYYKEFLKYKQALEEIREIVSEPCVAGENCITCNSNCTNKDILNKINEVLK